MKKVFIFLLAAVLLAVGMLSASAAETPETDYGCAVMLYDLHLLQGKGTAADGSVNFDVYGSLTRAESIVQVIRFLGVESTVKSGSYAHPFTDVPAWASNYIGYAYANGITSGRSAAIFDPNATVDAAQFTTLLLRAIGYSDAAGDFSWQNPFLLAKSIGMTDSESAPDSFSRGDAFRTCVRALYAAQKSGTPVYEALIQAGVFTMTDLTNAAASAKNATDPAEAGYYVLTKEEYMDKTTAGFLSQIAGFLSGFEFVRENGKLTVGMPDSWYKFLGGPYAVRNPNNIHETKLLLNAETRMWETWMDDDFSIDILDQYILKDMREQHGTVTSKVITDGWVKYNVYDMGGGNRLRGAYALAKYNRYLPAFLGAAEYGNRYNYCTEPWIGNETLGMNTAGMPNAAVYLAEMFGSVTGDRENVEWTKFVAAMYAMAYFESDIPMLIRSAAEVFGEGVYEREVIDACFAAYEKYPDDWRTAARAVEEQVVRRHDRMSDTARQLEMNVNNSLMLLGLLYGEGDYETTCRIISLAGYDGDCTAAVGMSVLGIIGGMDVLPDKVNERLWQDGKGEIVNLPAEGMDEMYWMCMLGLPERMKMAEIVEMYRENFEWLLIENGGKIENGRYYIPRAALRKPDVRWTEDFEGGSLDGYAVKKAALTTETIYEGVYSAKVENGGELTKTVSGLTVGQQYRLVSYVRTAEGAVAEIFARTKDTDGVYVTVENHSDVYIRRAFVFTATAETMELGMRVSAGDYALIDRLTLTRIDEIRAGSVTIGSPTADNIYAESVQLTANGTVGREVLLKLEFSNPTGALAGASVFVNNQRFNTAPLSKTGAAAAADQADFVYIPVVLGEGDNTIVLTFGGAKIHIRAVSLVTLTDTY